MRIIHIGHVPVPPEHPDYGTLPRNCFYPGRWVLNLALAQRELSDLEPEVIMQVPGATRDWSHVVEGVPVHFIAAPTRWRAATLFHFDALRLSRVIKWLRAELVHAHGTEEAAGLTAAYSGLPSVVTFQGVFALMNKVLPPRLISRHKFQEIAERRAVRRLRYGIVKSQYGADCVSPIFPHLKLFPIPNTYVAPLCPPQFIKGPLEMAIAGTIDPRKGTHLLAEALEEIRPKFPDLVLHVFGNPESSPAPYASEVLEKLKRLLGKDLILHGVAPKQELDETLARVRVLAAPSLEEMFGNQIIDALLVGTHVVVSSKTPMEENVNRFGNGSVFTHSDARSLAKVLAEALARDHSESARAAIKNIEQYMSPAAVATLHLEAYREILDDWKQTL